MEFETKDEHQAFPGIINGGIISTLLDCHGNWAATMALMEHSKNEFTMHSNFYIQSKIEKAHPLNSKLEITAIVSDLNDDRAIVKMTLEANGKICATGEGLFVAVKEGHPAYHRWN